jgi:hypothetical protein
LAISRRSRWARGSRRSNIRASGARSSSRPSGNIVGGGQRNLTQDLVWATSDPDLALCPNDPGHRSRVVALGAGDASVYATDTPSGIVSNDAVVPMLGELVRLIVRAPYPYRKFGAIPVGADASFPVTAVFQHGVLDLSRTAAGYVLESSDPSIGEIVGERRVRGLAPGTFELTARDLLTNLASDPVAVTVVGGLESITLTPATATRGIGEWESFTSIGFYPPGIEEQADAAARLRLERPDRGGRRQHARHAKPRADGRAGHRHHHGDARRDRCRRHGDHHRAARCDRARHHRARECRAQSRERLLVHRDRPLSGRQHDQRDADRDLGVAVAGSRRVDQRRGDRSRVVARSSGTAVITATHPSGVTSHDTGDDATFVAKELWGSRSSPASRLGFVGATQQYTLVGTFDDASTINLTQDAYYWVDDPAVALAENLDGDRSAAELLAPGFTTVHATFADWSTGFPVQSGDVADASLAVAPE